MNLVDYSDSEGSDTEAQVQQLPTASDAAPTASTKAGFQKVVDRSNPHKIRVSLPTSAAQQSASTEDGGFAENDRPAKRAKIGSAFSGFNSFLPAPKNPLKAGSAGADGVARSTLGSNRGGGLGRGFSLKTGAAPSFSREAPPPTDSRFEDGEDQAGDDDGYPVSTPGKPIANTEVVQEEVKLTGKTMMFKPLSVARKPGKKKTAAPATTPATNSAPKSMALKAQEASASTTVEVRKQDPPSQVKKSLFSSYNDDAVPIEIPQSEPHPPTPNENPYIESDDAMPPPTHQPAQSMPTAAASSANQSDQLNELKALADNLGLTASQRRHLFGRSGVAQDARVANFNLAAEYSNNKTLMENEANAAPVQKVRGIAPGKHSLQQLVNAAASQKDALEESFASGRRNKKDAGGRYGW